jgi:UPF0042 nucleotide-binding protein
VSRTPASPLELVVVTGLSGAGRSTAAKTLEDTGWFVVDNLPPSLISAVVELAKRSGGSVDRVAVVIDVRSRGFTADLHDSFAVLDRLQVATRLLFLEAGDDALVRRFDGVRRPHPLQGDGTVAAGIAAERELLRDLRGQADLVIDTTDLNIHELRARITAALDGAAVDRLSMTLLSFGYKWGVPVDADLVLDCRLLPNPHWVEELRPKTGLDPDVSGWVMAQAGAAEFLDDLTALLDRYATGYVSEGKHFATVAIGCTGGRHRSVAVVEELGRRLAEHGVDVHVAHRDLDRE